MVHRGVAGILHGRHRADLERTGGEEIVELRRGTRNQLGRQVHDAPVDGRINGIAVDPWNPAESHAACTTGKPAPRRARGSGGGSSKVSRTVRYRLSRSTGCFPAPRIRRTRSM